MRNCTFVPTLRKIHFLGDTKEKNPIFKIWKADLVFKKNQNQMKIFFSKRKNEMFALDVASTIRLQNKRPDGSNFVPNFSEKASIVP